MFSKKVSFLRENRKTKKIKHTHKNPIDRIVMAHKSYKIEFSMSEQEIPTRSDMEDRRLMRDFDSMKITKEGFGLCPKETHVYSIVNFQHSDDSSTPVSDANRSLTPLQTPPSRREHLRAMEYALKASDDELESLGIEVLVSALLKFLVCVLPN